MSWTPIILTLKLALLSSLILLIIGIPIANKLSNSKGFGKTFVETIISLPLVLPPTVLGFYLLVAFSPNNAFGMFLGKYFNLNLVFSFEGLVLASIIYSLPFMVQPIHAGLSNLPAQLKEASYSLGKSKFETLFRVLLPNIKPAILTAFTLSFAHTLGEFGVVLMIGGNIPGVTKVASIAIYDEVEAMNYGLANSYALSLLLLSFIMLLLVYSINKKRAFNFWK
jgi:molybdate transport system permease protein